jgi:hypothetical protein
MTPRDKLFQIVRNAKGDDLERAERAFGHLSASQLKENYGESGNSKGNILEGYRKERKLWQEAFDLLQQKV